jgi:apolipoprotein N-acyltransferase
MKSPHPIHSIFLSLLSGVLIGLSVNHGYNLAFLLPFCMLGIFSSLEKQTRWTGWMLHGWLFSITSMALALIGFAWVEVLAGSIMIAIGSVIFTVPFVLLYFIRQLLSTQNAWSFALLGFIWPPYTWFVKEHILGFPITLFDISLSNYPVFIQFMSVTGATGAATWVIILNVFIFLLYRLFLKHNHLKVFHNKAFKNIAAGLLLWFSLPLLYAWYAYSVVPDSYQGYVKAAVIQHGFPDSDLDLTSQEAVFAMLDVTLALTDSAVANHQPDLIVWPEGELPISIRTDYQGLQFIADRVLRWQTPLSTGLSDIEFTSNPVPPLQAHLGRDYFLYNAVAMITPQLAWRVLMENETASALNVYRKVNLMPFTEFVPFSDRYPWLSRFAVEFGENQHLQPGTAGSPLAFLTRDGRIVQTLPYICWDILFASTHTAENLGKAHLITAHTSARLFGRDLKTSLLGMKNYTRLRSVEARKSIINSSTTGYSFFTNPFGEILGLIDPYVAGYTVHEIPLHQAVTFYHRYPHLFPSLCLLVLIVLMATRPILPKFQHHTINTHK